MWSKRLTTAAALTALAVPMAMSPAGAEPAAAPKAPSTGTAGTTITLITGDKVTLRGEAVRVTPGAGRKTGFLRLGTGDDLTVIPADVAGLVADGTLDTRLFQVKRLAKDGFDDASAKTLPLIVQYAKGARSLSPLSADAKPLTSINGFAVAPAKDQPILPRLLGTGLRSAGSAVERIWLDGKVTASLDKSVAQIGAPEAWAAGQTGQGVKVAVLDTGIDPTHPDLAGQIEAAENFTGWGTTNDGHGHGTHVASTIAGLGVGSTTVRKGVAPGVRLLIGKVLSDGGSGSESGIIAGMEWAAHSGAKVISMSLGGPDSPESDPMEQAVERLTAETKTLFVIAAGNDGPESSTLGSPGSADAALTVGAVDREDVPAYFSSRGPRLGDNAVKPDLVAPGVGIVAARSSMSDLSVVDGKYTTMSGTSMATPHVAGAAAILAGQHPDWSGQQIKSALVGSTKALAQVGGFVQGSGRLDVARVVRQAVTADSGLLAFGSVPYPYEAVADKTVTYRNDGTAPVTLELSAQAATNSGEAAPAGMFTVPATVTVPAGGTAEVKVGADVKAGPAGPYAGRLTARTADDAVVVHTTLSLDKQVRTRTTRITLLDQEGGVPEPAYSAVYFFPVSGGQRQIFGIENGAGEVSLPEGRYLALASLGTMPAEGDYTQSLAILPDVNITGDSELVFDARSAKPTDITTDKSDVETIEEELLLTKERSGDLTPIYVAAMSQWGMRFMVTPTKDTEGFSSRLWTIMAKRGAEGGYDDSPYTYHLIVPVKGRVPDSYRVRDRELGQVKADYAALRRQLIVPMDVGPQVPESWGPMPSRLEVPTRLPVSRTEYFTPGVEFERVLNTFITVELGDPQIFTAGRRTHERWNTAVIAPALPSWAGITRKGEQLSVLVPHAHTPDPNRTGFFMYHERKTTLLLDGKEVGTEQNVPGIGFPLAFTAPASTGQYKVVMEGTADEYATELSQTLKAEWTFRSAADGQVPLVALLAQPKLDLNSAAPAGPMLLPLRLDRADKAADLAVRKVTAEVSYDDGTTWQRVPVVPTGKDTFQAILMNPAKPGGFASLRLSAHDAKGDGVTQTMTRAFRLR